jgi:hypothetical protein
MDQWRKLLFQAKGSDFRPSTMDMMLTKCFDPGMVASFGGQYGQIVDYGGAVYRVPDALPSKLGVSQYEVAFTHLLQLLPAFQSAGATDFVLHMQRTCSSQCNEEFTRSELQLLASLGCHFVYAAREDWGDDARLCFKPDLGGHVTFKPNHLGARQVSTASGRTRKPSVTAHSLIINFRDFLLVAFPAWSRSAEIALERNRGFLDEAFDDWAQANWELLVERPLCGPDEFLEIYGSGSDLEQQMHSRVFFHDAQATHDIRLGSHGQVAVDLLSGDMIDLADFSIQGLVARVGAGFNPEPPFDHVLASRGSRQALVPLSAVTFVCDKVRIDCGGEKPG